MLRVSIIVPTFKEAQNLSLLVPRISYATKAAGISSEIIIVDDNSCDGTAAVCDVLSREYPVRLHVREKERGLSSAVLAGMDLARGELLLVLDADLSHPPEKIPELVQAFDDPAVDFAIGSRYVSGGSTASDWGLRRWFNSRIATLLAWPLSSVKDPMAGFFALRRQSYSAAIDRLDPIGYKIGLELLVKCGCRRIVEVPINFEDRLFGESKLSVRERVNYLRHLRRLYNFRFGVWAFLAQFILIGATGLALDLTWFSLFLTVMPLAMARGFAIWIAMTWNFWLNRLITFSFARTESWWRQYMSFCAGCSLGALINWSTTLSLIRYSELFQNQKSLAAAVGVIAGTFFNFALCKVLVFRKPKPCQIPPRFELKTSSCVTANSQP